MFLFISINITLQHVNVPYTLISNDVNIITAELGREPKHTFDTPALCALPTFDTDFLALVFVEVPQQHVLPVTPVADETQVRQRSLGRAYLVLRFT